MPNGNIRWEVDVAGMSCERHVARAVGSVGGTGVSASWRGGTVTFTAADVDEVALMDAVGEAGYEARGRRRLELPSTPVTGTGRASTDEFDLAVLGAGSAAFAAAIRATEAGARVVMIEQGPAGGTCVNVGCVPSKALLAAADTYHHARTHTFAGIPNLDATAPDLAALVAQNDDLVGAMHQAKYLDLVEDYGFALRHGTARFADHDTITVDGEPLRATKYLIATGARPVVPPIEGLDQVDYLTSTSALELTEVPARLAVIGANAIGLELGQAFGKLGSEVTFLDVAEQIAPFEEPEIAAALAEVLTGDGARVLAPANVSRVTQAPDGTVTLEGGLGDAGTRLPVDRVLVATGRAPNADLALDSAGVKVDARGFVVVDEHLRTTSPRVWAAGDVTASAQFVYVSAAEGAIAADNAIGGAERHTDYRTLPRITFTSPPLAAVGLTETQATDTGHAVVTSVLSLGHVPRAIINRDTRGVIKLVADADTDQLLGVHMAGENAGEVIQAGVYALMAGLTVSEIAAAFHPYLTMAEGLKLAAQTFQRDITHLSCCAA